MTVFGGGGVLFPP